MTEASPDHDYEAFHDADSAGCLLIIGGYTDTAATLGSIADKAADRILRSPDLGDFIELRHVDIGPRPRAAAQPVHAVAIVSRELTRPSDGAGRTYFALVIADRSAAAAEQVLQDCAADPVIAGLPLRSRGFASVEDRYQGGRKTRDTKPRAGQAFDIVVSPEGSWTIKELAAALNRYAAELLHDFAAGPERGLTARELDALRAASTPQAAPEPGTAPDRAAAEPSRPVIPPEPDALRPQPPPTAHPPAPAGIRRPPGPAAAPPPGATRPRTRRAVVPGWLRRAARLGWRVLVLAGKGLALLGRGAWFLVLWAFQAAQRRRSSAWPPPPDLPADHNARHGLLFLLLNGDSSGNTATWRRGRSMLRQTAAMMSTTLGTSYWVRAEHNIESAAQRPPRPVGQSARLRRSSGHPDFAQALSVIRVQLSRDMERLNTAGLRVAQPVIVFYALTVPPADPVASEIYAELSRTAAIVWVVPERLTGLMSPLLRQGAARVITDHQGAADEVTSLLRRITGEDRA